MRGDERRTAGIAHTAAADAGSSSAASMSVSERPGFCGGA